MRRVLGCIALVCVSGCSRAALTVDRGAVLLSDRAAPREGCRVEFTPDPLPSLNQLADSAQLTQAVTASAQPYRMATQKMTALYTVQFGEDGRPSIVQAIDYFLPQGESERLAGFIRQSARRQEHTPWSIRLRVEPNAATVFHIGRSERCPPVSNTRFQLLAPAAMGLQRPQRMRVRMTVRATGQAEGLQLEASSGNSELDLWVLQNLERAKFSPGLLDGQAVSMTHEEIVEIRVR